MTTGTNRYSMLARVVLKIHVKQPFCEGWMTESSCVISVWSLMWVLVTVAVSTWGNAVTADENWTRTCCKGRRWDTLCDGSSSRCRIQLSPPPLVWYIVRIDFVLLYWLFMCLYVQRISHILTYLLSVLHKRILTLLYRVMLCSRCICNICLVWTITTSYSRPRSR